MTGLDGKTAVVTGASTLMGAKVVEAFVNAGATVVMADVNEDDGQSIAAKLDGKASFIKTDVTSDKDIDTCLPVFILIMALPRRATNG